MCQFIYGNQLIFLKYINKLFKIISLQTEEFKIVDLQKREDKGLIHRCCVMLHKNIFQESDGE